jgi:hypothetical protein
MATKELPSIDDLRKRLGYNPETGDIISIATGKKVFTNVHHSGYLKGYALGKTMTAHRVAMALQLGYWPQGEIDHINGNKRDNRACNLRVVTKSENQRNSKRRSDNKSGHAGVCKKGKRWIAYINKNGKRTYLGGFSNVDDAVNARKAAQEKFGGFSDRHGR